MREAPFVYSCPSESTVTFHCNDSVVYSLEWIPGEYFSSVDQLIFFSSLIESGSNPVEYNGEFIARLTKFTAGHNINVADLESTLTVTKSGVDNGTEIICETSRENLDKRESVILYYAGIANREFFIIKIFFC